MHLQLANYVIQTSRRFRKPDVYKQCKDANRSLLNALNRNEKIETIEGHYKLAIKTNTRFTKTYTSKRTIKNLKKLFKNINKSCQNNSRSKEIKEAIIKWNSELLNEASSNEDNKNLIKNMNTKETNGSLSSNMTSINSISSDPIDQINEHILNEDYAYYDYLKNINL